jgi:hypothetical protein
MIIDDEDFCRVSFSGEWKDDFKVRGIIKYREMVKVKYDGQLLNDRPHGKGVITYVNGDVH